MEINFPKLEEKILKFWKDSRIFEKSVERRTKAREFVFYEGPPTANGRPGIHHVLSRVFKDIICRYKTMRGFRVQRKAGWDTHGLPVELEIEKKLGIRSKPEIERFGIKKFNQECKKSVWLYKEEWEKLTERIGFWLDMENPYITYAKDYVETVWRILKKIWQKNLLYQDFKVVPHCPRCGTSLSSHEVALGYKSVKEPSIYVKFPIKNPKFGNASLLVWTTTPWTLPGNVAVAINPNFTYVKARVIKENSFFSPSTEVSDGDDFLILAKERAGVLGGGCEITEEFPGKDLLGLTYQSPFSFYKPDYKKEKIWETIPADFVSLEDGSGLVHIAPAFGEEDMEAVKDQNAKLRAQNLPSFPVLMTVDEQGKFNLDIEKWANLFVKDADPLIIEDLKTRGILFKEEIYEHDYPFCWRCRSPLLYYAKKSWFIRMTQVKQDLIKNNREINWVPGHLKEGRFGEWLREVKDWALSRERYWGTPLPIWRCASCQETELEGSLADILDHKFSGNNYYLFRHGHSLRQVKKVSSCWPEKIPFPLTKEGEIEVSKNAQKLKSWKIDLIFSSDLLRAKQTAKIISRETGVKVIFDKRLRDYDVGAFNYKDPKLTWDYLEKKPDFLAAKLPRGESLKDIQKRMFGFLKSVDEKYRGKNIVTVSHELPLTILEESLKGKSLSEILEQRRLKKIKNIGTGEIRKVDFKILPYDENMEIDLHRPQIDEIKFLCPKCGGIMSRVSEVIDCWFDSGSMPFAQASWLGPKSPALFPADYISEAVDQTRGWFYTLLAISTLLGFGPAYKNVISSGLVLDEKGEKMSKSRGNVVNPWDVIGKYGIDSVRWYFYTVNQPGEPKLFSEKDIDRALKKFILTFWNCFAFWETYKGKSAKSGIRNPKPRNVLDKWIISRLNRLVSDATISLDEYDPVSSARAIERFAAEDLSLWYVRRSRRRFQKPENKKELAEASEILGFVLLTLSKLTAPFVPFISEQIYQNILYSKFNIQHSVHLDNWPKADKKIIDENLEKEMDEARKIVSQALAERAKAGIKVRQPLSSLKVRNPKSEIRNDKELLDLIKDEVNIKEIVFDENIKAEVEVDINITPELKEEGIVREVIRYIQEMRKESGLKPQDGILINYASSENLGKILERSRDFILKEAKAEKLVSAGKKLGTGKQVKIGEESLALGIKKAK